VVTGHRCLTIKAYLLRDLLEERGMLDLDHPRTPFVFAASQQLDLIIDYCKRITLSGTSGRLFMLEVIRPAFVALRWLASERFPDSPEIAASVAELEREAEQLAELPLLNPDQSGGPAERCPACGRPPNAPDMYDPTSYCWECLELIRPGLMRVQSDEQGFGTESI
jgi:hypothetical protein